MQVQAPMNVIMQPLEAILEGYIPKVGKRRGRPVKYTDEEYAEKVRERNRKQSAIYYRRHQAECIEKSLDRYYIKRGDKEVAEGRTHGGRPRTINV